MAGSPDRGGESGLESVSNGDTRHVRAARPRLGGLLPKCLHWRLAAPPGYATTTGHHASLVSPMEALRMTGPRDHAGLA